MKLKSDSQGFLLGTALDIGAAVQQLKRIRNDIHDIKNALFGTNSATKSANKVESNSPALGAVRNENKPSHRSVTPTRTKSDKTPLLSAVTPKTKTVTPLTPAAVNTAALIKAVSPKAVATPNGRDSSGRFTAKDKSEAERNKTTGRFTSNDKEDGGKDRKDVGIIGDLVSRLANVATVSTSGAQDADVSIKAFNEVASPMMRGYQTLSGGGDKGGHWYKKIFRELSLSRKENTVFNKAQNKVLKNIDDKTGSGGDDDSSGGVMLAIGALLGRIGPLLLTGITGVLGLVFSPIGLAISAASVAAWALFSESGQKFFGDVGAKIIEGWNSAVAAFSPITESMSSGWESVKSGFDGLIQGMVAGWDAFTGFLKDKFGIDLPAIFKPVAEVGKKVIDKAQAGVDVVKEGAKSVASKAAATSPKTTKALGNVWDKIKEGAGSLTDKVTEGAGKISSHASGKTAVNKAAMIAEMDAQGMTDPKERAMLMAQVDHESGGFTSTKEKGHTRSSSVMAVSKTARDAGKPAVDAAVAQGGDAVAELMYGGRMGNTEKGDGAKYKGRGLVQLTGKDNYAAAGKDLGLDLVNHPELAESPENAAKTAMWFWKKNKLGDSARKGDLRANTKTLNGGLNGYDHRDEKYNQYLAEGTKGGDKSVSIATNTPPPINNMAVWQGGSNPTQTAFSPSPRVPSFSKAPAPAEAPQVMQPLSSNYGMEPRAQAPSYEVGQNLSSRSLAHIVTGGLSGTG